jgi:Uma2 family endonuclease
VAAFQQAPQWVLEVVSPGTCRIDRVLKLPIYAREGVAHAWLVDPLVRTLEVYRLKGKHWLLAATHGGDEIVRAEPFEAMELAMARWWLPEAEEAGP